jgi:two-component system chemotaxis response regulator CheY
VDENDAVRDLLVTTLMKAGIRRCVGIRSAIDALWRMKTKQDVQLILSEWKMSPLDGLAFCKRLREESGPAARVTFVLVTGREQRPLVEFALKSGVDGYIIKPFRLQALFDHLDLLMRKDSERRERLRDQLAALNCLVVNQHGASCDQIAALLTEAGLREVVTAHTGAAVLRMLKDRRIHLLVYDLNVKAPDWRGLLKELGTMPRTPALLLTSVLPTQEELDTMRSACIANFLPGPFAQAELLAAVVKAASLRPEDPPPRQPGT